MVQQARSDDTHQALAAVQMLCTRYQRAIHAWFQRSRPAAISPAHAEEWAQDFLLWVCEKNLFARIERRQSKFRAFLVTCLRNFLKNKLEAERALKRGTGAAHLELEPLDLPEPADDSSRSRCGTRPRASRTVTRIDSRSVAAKDDGPRFEALEARILGGGEQGYTAIAARARVETEPHQENCLRSARRLLPGVPSEVANLVHDPAELDHEFHYRMGLLIRREINRAAE
jgi:DNA-directed RNA polymerase specialized sigma24 family protein